MTLSAAITATRRRRLRPEAYRAASGAIIAFLLVVVIARFGGNIYLSISLAAGSAARSESMFAVLVAWCGLLTGTLAPIMTYRGAIRTARSRRIRLLPVTRWSLFRAVVATAYRSPAGYLPPTMAVVCWLAVAHSVSGLLPLLIALAVGAFGLAGVIAAAWGLEVADQQLEIIELLILVTVMLANPDLSIQRGTPALTLFSHVTIPLGGASSVPVSLLIPACGCAAVAVALVLTRLVRIGESGDRRRSYRPATPVLILYRAGIPTGIFAVTLAIDLAIIITNPAVHTTVRNFVLGFFLLHAIWLTVFVFRIEQRAAVAVHAPSSFADRVRIYTPAALVHGGLTLAPVLLFAVRALVTP